jgi:hypothetical protein
MKQKKNEMYWIMGFVLAVGSIQVFGKPLAKGPYLGQIPPGSTAKVFAPGLISDTRPQTWEAGGSFSADGNTFCFMRVGGVFITENTNQGWTAPKLIESTIEYSAWGPCLSADANSIYFTKAVGPLSQRNIYRIDRTAHGWTSPQKLRPPLSSSDKEFSCSIAANNNIYLCSERKGSDGRSTIWVVPFIDKTWAQAEQIFLDHQQVNDAGIAPDESFMVFTSKYLPGGYGNRDLYLTVRLPDGAWSRPRNLGPKINSKYIEHSPRISPDKKYLFFNRSNGWDPRIYSSDIYWVELKEHLPDPNDPNINQTDLGIGIGSSAEPFAKGPYLGQTPPGPIPKIFAPRLICDTQPHKGESSGTFSVDGNTFCFSRSGYVYITENTDQGWTTPKRIESIPYMSVCCCLSPDANSIYFNYSYDPSKPYSLHRCMRTSQGWSLPQELGPPFSRAFGGFSVAADNSIYFSESGKGHWFAPFVGNTWPRAIQIPVVPIEGKYNGCQPGIAPDESFMVFYSIRPGAQRGTETDLYLTLRRPDGTWTELRNMGPRINTRYFEWGARISPDKKYMFFTRANGWGYNSNSDTSDIYWVALKEYLPESYR